MTTVKPQGTPIHRNAPVAPLAYNFIPDLRWLLPKNAGRPGVEYLTVSALNLMEAQNTGYSMIENSRMFTIQGSQGSVDCQLYGRGEPIRGIDSHSGRRVHKVDAFVVNMTGLRPSRFQEVVEFTHTGAPTPVPSTVAKPTPKPSSKAEQLVEDLKS
jgi:hypothetical protein